MGIVTLFFLVVFSILYIGKGLEKKPAALDRAIGNITDNIDSISLIALAYAVFAAIMTPILNFSGEDVFSGIGVVIRMIANIVLFIMALPFAFDGLVSKYSEKINPAILENLRESVNNIANHEKNVGYAGAVSAAILFALLFR